MRAGELKNKISVYSCTLANRRNRVYSTAESYSFRGSVNYKPTSKTIDRETIDLPFTTEIYGWRHISAYITEGSLLKIFGDPDYYEVIEVCKPSFSSNLTTIRCRKVFDTDINWETPTTTALVAPEVTESIVAIEVPEEFKQIKAGNYVIYKY